VEPWLPFALGALLVWSVQRVITKIALVNWSTAYFYRLNAVISLVAYLPYAVLVPPDPGGLPGALGLALLMAATFWVTTEATRRGPVGLVAPLTAISPAITAALAVLLLGERPGSAASIGVFLAPAAGVLIAYRPAGAGSVSRWLALALASMSMQGIGAFVAKIVVTGHGPTDLLLVGAMVQLLVGLALARDEPIGTHALVERRGMVIVATLAAAALATTGYLFALSIGPASVIVPLVATSPALGGALGIVVLHEPFSRRQVIGIALGATAAALLAAG
jgi:uncharacterized membrane protein